MDIPLEPSDHCRSVIKYIFFNSYWSIVDLQCWVSFRYTAKWISYTYTYIYSFLDHFPIQTITEYWVEFPVLNSRSLLVICFIYSSACMSIPVSHFLNVSLPCSLHSSLVTISLFSTSVTFLLFSRAFVLSHKKEQNNAIGSNLKWT